MNVSVSSNGNGKLDLKIKISISQDRDVEMPSPSTAMNSACQMDISSHRAKEHVTTRVNLNVNALQPVEIEMELGGKKDEELQKKKDQTVVPDGERKTLMREVRKVRSKRPGQSRIPRLPPLRAFARGSRRQPCLNI
ncbi:unnamed protein product [Orchesella dallaii]|uniref:Uncharacterized protein n=1 Tax=Orchesella dallaii TaxID=48710 RepID=A0ABP1R2V1_9HEXA